MFAFAALLKLATYAKSTKRMQALGYPKLGLAALVVAELLVAALLIVREDLGAYLAIVTLSAFTFVLVWLRRNNTALPCPCFGSNAEVVPNGLSIVRNIGLIAIAVLVALS